VVAELPSGTVTFLFTDIEGSTRLWEEHPKAMQAALARHDVILHGAIGSNRGFVVKTTGDGCHAVFARAHDAIEAAGSAQSALMSERWAETGPLRVRMGVHTGSAELRDADYYGPAVNRAARLMAVAHGGQVVVSQVTGDLVIDDLSDGLELLDLGEHRLRDLSRVERVYQLCGPGLTREFPALVSSSEAVGNLPVALSSFIGRAGDLVEVADALESARVVTLVGVGGVGKTRLALQSATEVSSRYRDGVWWSELAGVRDVDGVPGALAGALALVPRDESNVMASVLEFLHAKQLLLVLDNCEHLARPVAAMVREIEAACAGVQVLATSREGLKVPGEQMVMVVALDLPDEDDEVGLISESDAVQLFVERGRAVRPGFVVDSKNAGSVARLCRRLDGLPLAIELAAARLAVLTPDELARRLDQRFRLLTGGERTAVERHQTLRAAVDWSYELLEPGERQLFDRLGMFTGGFALEAAEVVCAGDGIEEAEIFDLLASLVARSLVVADAEAGETRYRLLETLRQYAQEHLAESMANDETRARHAAYYTRFAELAAAQLAGPYELEWQSRLNAESGNLVAALVWSLDHRDVDLALRLTRICEWHWVSATEIGRTLQASADAAVALPAAETSQFYTSALVQAAWHALGYADNEAATSRADRARDIDEEQGRQPTGVYWSLRTSIAQFSGRSDEAPGFQQQTLDVYRTSGDTVGLARALGAQAVAFYNADDPRSRAAADELIELLPQLTSARTKVEILAQAGYALSNVEPERALQLVRRSAALAHELGASGYGFPTAIAAGITARRGDTRDALELFAAAMPDLRWLGQRLALGGVILTVSGLLVDQEPDAAAVLLGAAEALGGQSASAYTVQQHEHAVEVLSAALDPPRRTELLAEGRAMDDAESTDYAVAVIKRILAQSP
jgi:predicted ATPase/class 3 adenylate cyclase